MRYINAKAILPEQLLRELQKYIQGEVMYVPGNESFRAGWGENNGTKEKYLIRNREIILLYRNGMRMEALADRFHLSEHSIKKIIHGSKNKIIKSLLSR